MKTLLTLMHCPPAPAGVRTVPHLLRSCMHSMVCYRQVIDIMHCLPQVVGILEGEQPCCLYSPPTTGPGGPTAPGVHPSHS